MGGAGGRETLYIYTVNTLHTLYTLHITHATERKIAIPEERRKKVGTHFGIRISLGNPNARAYEPTNETKRNDFPVGLTSQPPTIAACKANDAEEAMYPLKQCRQEPCGLMLH